MTDEDLPYHLQRNATCPLCHKPYHNIDVHNNPVPSKKNKRSEDDLCQCAKGIDARTARKAYRIAKQEEAEAIEAQKLDFLGMEDKNKSFWERVRENNKTREVREQHGITTEN